MKEKVSNHDFYCCPDVEVVFKGFAGSVCSYFFAEALMKNFSGKGLISDDIIQSVDFVLAVAFGGGATVLLATMSRKISGLNHGQGFTANLITGALVITASKFGFPVSTTHVAVGSIYGVGVVKGTARSKAVSRIFLSWVLTLPVAAILSALFFAIFYYLI